METAKFFNIYSYIILTIFVVSMSSNIIALSMIPNFKVGGKISSTIAITFIQFGFNCIMAIYFALFKAELVGVEGYYVFHLVYWDSPNISYFILVIMTFFIYICYYYNLVLVALNTFVRYLHVTNTKIEFKHVVLICVISLIIVCIITTNSFYFGLVPDADPHAFYKNLLENNITDVFTDATSQTVAFDFAGKYFFLIIGTFVCSYVLIIYSLTKYHTFMTKQTHGLSEQTKKMNNEFFKILCIQALIPAVIEFLPIILYLSCVGLKIYEANNMGTWCLIISSIIPSCNCIYFLVALSKSRNILKRRYVNLSNYLCGNKVTAIGSVS
uniref:G_PROTEIN_RECEP_F1_2 domain-containing protein n=1 Tax=Rhabditophanes sp. KR3021 TaxID=114890 RepID=A0AC35UCY5_9BILA